jgi:hypothetical protein
MLGVSLRVIRMGRSAFTDSAYTASTPGARDGSAQSLGVMNLTESDDVAAFRATSKTVQVWHE